MCGLIRKANRRFDKGLGTRRGMIIESSALAGKSKAASIEAAFAFALHRQTGNEFYDERMASSGLGLLPLSTSPEW
jgi:hypothetical protein